MQIKTINIRKREGFERMSKDAFIAEITLEGGKYYPADIKIGIPQDMLDPIVGIVAQAVVDSMAGATKAFHEEVRAMLVGPAIEQIASD